MLIIKANGALHDFISLHRQNGQRIGFVPTMGALHAGHLELIQAARETCDLVVCSIFVNPTQFNDPSDLEKYPRPLEQDIALLAAQGCHILYIPAVDSIYPSHLETRLHLDPGPIAQVMEGASRPGHFDGVMQVVHRLLVLVQPDELVMGQKDYQQVAVIRYMLEATKSKVLLAMCPTYREDDGLAFSSRNVRLTPAWRTVAPVIYQTLCWAKKTLDQKAPRELEKRALAMLEENGLLPDYFSVVDGYTLQEITDPAAHQLVVACTAVWAGQVRLIDNLVLKSEKVQ
jgi:pantoate--beta-alanine ligase